MNPEEKETQCANEIAALLIVKIASFVISFLCVMFSVAVFFILYGLLS